MTDRTARCDCAPVEGEPRDPVTSMLAGSFLPSTGVLEMTYRCDHRCLFCSCPWEAEGNGFERLPELSTDEWLAVIDGLTGRSVTSLAFTGGEPLLRDDLETLLRYAATREVEHIESIDGRLELVTGRPRLYLLTNGRNLCDRVLDLCTELGIHLSISLPGVSTYVRHIGRSGRPENVLRWLRQAEQKGVATTAAMTVTRLNLHEVYETIAEALLAGAGQILLNRFLPGGRGLRHVAELALDTEGVQRMLEEAAEALEDAGRDGHVGTELPSCVLRREGYGRLNVGSRCAAATGFFCVDPSGFVRACNHSPVRLVPFAEIDTLPANPHWRQFALRDFLPASCHGCYDIAACDAGCREAARIVSGRVDGPDPLMA